MKKFLFATIIFLISFFNFEYKGINPVKIAEGDGLKVSIDSALNYFPTQLGKEFVYELKFGETDPISQERIVWSEKNHQIVYFFRRRISSFDQANYPDGSFLKFGITQFGSKLVSDKAVNWVSLDINQDDFGIYGESKQIVWAANVGDPFVWQEKRIYPPQPFIAPEKWKTNGYSKGVLFFDGKPGDEIPFYSGSRDRVTFSGVDKVPGLNVLAAHFVKTFSYRKNCNTADEYANQAFEEHTYFVKGKGMVFLEQKVDGKTSMTWRLVDSEKK